MYDDDVHVREYHVSPLSRSKVHGATRIDGHSEGTDHRAHEDRMMESQQSSGGRTLNAPPDPRKTCRTGVAAIAEPCAPPPAPSRRVGLTTSGPPTGWLL
eukprot:7183293-Prymnesium_polylepis.2